MAANGAQEQRLLGTRRVPLLLSCLAGSFLQPTPHGCPQLSLLCVLAAPLLGCWSLMQPLSVVHCWECLLHLECFVSALLGQVTIYQRPAVAAPAQTRLRPTVQDILQEAALEENIALH